MALKKTIKPRSGWVGEGVQGSPFNDEIFANWILTMTDASKPPSPQQPALTIDALTPHLIYRYGFYQGGMFRTDPKVLVQFFGL